MFVKLKMGKKAKNQYLLSGMLAILFLLLIVFLRFVDVEAIGPEETKIGLSHLNGGFHKLFDYNVIWYTVSKIAGYFMFAVPVFFMLFALIQLISRKSVTLVDRPLLALGGLYAATAQGARAMGVPECDSLAVGKKADIVMIDIAQPNMQPENNLVTNLVYSGSKQNVKMTMVNGRILYEDGRFDIGFEPKEIYAKANEIIRRMK